VATITQPSSGRGPACVGAEERGELAAACVLEALDTLTFPSPDGD